MLKGTLRLLEERRRQTFERLDGLGEKSRSFIAIVPSPAPPSLALSAKPDVLMIYRVVTCS